MTITKRGPSSHRVDISVKRRGERPVRLTRTFSSLAEAEAWEKL